MSVDRVGERVTSGRWTVTTVADNAGRPLNVWTWGEYELAQNVNLGLEGGWVFELTLKHARVGLYPTLGEGKQGAYEREAGAQEARTQALGGR